MEALTAATDSLEQISDENADLRHGGRVPLLRADVVGHCRLSQWLG